MSLRRIRAVANIPMRRKVDRETDLNNAKIKTENTIVDSPEKDQTCAATEKSCNLDQLFNSKLKSESSDIKTIIVEQQNNNEVTSYNNTNSFNSNSNTTKPVFNRSRIKISAKIPVRTRNVDCTQVSETVTSAKKSNSELDLAINEESNKTSIDNRIDFPSKELGNEYKSFINKNLLVKHMKNNNTVNNDQIQKKCEYLENKDEAVVSLETSNKCLLESENSTIQVDDVQTENHVKVLEIVDAAGMIGSRDQKSLAPPQSPSKLIPRRYRPTPRTDRRSSIAGSASESEDDSKRSHTSRFGLDINTTSVMNSGQENVIPDNKVEIYSNLKKKKTWSDMARKMAEARREFQNKFGDKIPDRQKLTMMDLIFYNPPNNPMTRREVLTNLKQDTKLIVKEESQKEEEAIDDPNEEEENSLPAPRVKVGPNGEIILDEQSLVIETSDMKKAREFTPTTVVVDDLNDEYGVYKRSKRTKGWTESETVRFYRVLQITGTDFSMMLSFFSDRSRRDLKLKFKKEERMNRRLIDKVLLNPRTFDLDECKRLLEKDSEEEIRKKELARKKEEIRKSEVKTLKRARQSNENETGKRKKKLSWFGRQVVEDEVIEPPKNRTKNSKRKRQYSINLQTESELNQLREKYGIELKNSSAKEEGSKVFTSTNLNVLNGSILNPLGEDSQSSVLRKSQPLLFEKQNTDEVNVTAAVTIADVEPGSVFIRLSESPSSGRQIKQAYTVFSDDPNKSVMLTQDQTSLLDSYLDGNDLVSLDLPVVDGTLMDDGTFIVNEH